MIVDVECPCCNGTGEVLGGTPNVRARYVHYDDLNPDDFGAACPKCGGIGIVSYNPVDEVEGWMDDA